jgi:hypothetical protein
MLTAKIQANKKEYKIILRLNDQKNEIRGAHIHIMEPSADNCARSARRNGVADYLEVLPSYSVQETAWTSGIWGGFIARQ